MAYGLDRLGQELRIAVVDLGGGTLDVTVMEFGKGVFEVKATSGDTQLGGTDMDQRLFEHLVERFREQTGVDVRDDRKAAARLREAAEMAKIELSSNATTHVSLPFLAASAGAADPMRGSTAAAPICGGASRSRWPTPCSAPACRCPRSPVP